MLTCSKICDTICIVERKRFPSFSGKYIIFSKIHTKITMKVVNEATLLNKMLTCVFTTERFQCESCLNLIDSHWQVKVVRLIEVNLVQISNKKLEELHNGFAKVGF